MSPPSTLVQFNGRWWFIGEKKRLRAVLEAAESALEATESPLQRGPTRAPDPPSSAFFEARWQVSVYLDQSARGNGLSENGASNNGASDETALDKDLPHRAKLLRRFTAVRAGHSRVFSASTLDALCAQIQGDRPSNDLSLDGR